MTSEQQTKIDHMTLGDLRRTRDELNDQLGAIETNLVYLSNYLKKHRPYDNEIKYKYVMRMRECDNQNPLIFFANVYDLYLESKNRR